MVETHFPKLLLLLISLPLSLSFGEVVNENVKRTIDLSTNIASITVDIDVKNDGKTTSYDFIVPSSKHVAYFEAKTEKKQLKYEFDGNNIFQIAMPVPQSMRKLKIKYILTNVLTPLPEEIKQNDNQLVVYDNDFVFFPSPYVTAEQTTTVKLYSSKVESFSEFNPTVIKASKITYGPYQHIKPEESRTVPLRIHYENNYPFAVFTNVEKEIEVSHWGNVAIEEQYELRHAGAKLVGGFSRLDYQMQMKNLGNAFRSLHYDLPKLAKDIYYRDIIGNISTSYVRQGKKYQEMEIETRFPMFGGWKCEWYTGYNLPLSSVVTVQEGNTYKLTTTLSSPIRGSVIDNLQVNIILPQGATNIDTSKIPWVASQDQTTRYTYLDNSYAGRPVIILKFSNLVQNHNVNFSITYEYQSGNMVQKPLMLSGFFFCCYVLYAVFLRLDFSIDRNQTSSDIDFSKKNK